jgi:uncharacterized protein
MARLSALSPEECMALLASVPVGRVVFTHRALPAIRPVNNVVDRGSVIIRTNLGSGLGTAATDGMAMASGGTPEASPRIVRVEPDR